MSSRRDFLKAGGALVVGFAWSKPAFAQQGVPDARQIDTWIAIHADNTATVYIGFAELGQGNTTALLQVAAEELDYDMSQVSSVTLETNVTPNQGGTYSSRSVQAGSPQIRTAAAEARQVLLKMASERLGTSQLTVAKGVVSGNGKSVTYGELIGGKRFNIAFTGNAPTKATSSYKLVGTKFPRNDMPEVVNGTRTFMQHLRVDGMLHGRVVRPRGQRSYMSGAKVLSVDESSIASIPGAKAVRMGDFVGVVAEQEWDAVRAAQQLKVTWDKPPALPGDAKLYESMRAAQTQDRVVTERGDAAATIAAAKFVATQGCKSPYQSHAPFAPNCAIADVKKDSALVMCSTQDIYATRTSLARVLGLPATSIRVQYHTGAGIYGHGCYDDVAHSAAILSQLAGKPVRLQFMRWDEHGWDPYGPAHVGEVRASANAEGKITGYEYHGWHQNWTNVETSEQLAKGVAGAEWPGAAAQQVNPMVCGGAYDIPNLKLVNHKVAPMFRGGWLRSPLDLSFAFASDQAIDQLAYLLGIDPYQFRKQNIKDPRWMGVLDAVASASKWSHRKAASKLSSAKVVTGRGIGVGTHLVSYGAAVAEIEVNKETGKVVAKHLYGAIDAGQVVNPGNVESQIEGQLVQAASRLFKEEIHFDETGVTSLDWNGYQIMRMEECPEVTGIVVQRMNERSTGAGEESMAACAAAIGNAFFDATGVRMHEFPMTPARVLAALHKK